MYIYFNPSLISQFYQIFGIFLSLTSKCGHRYKDGDEKCKWSVHSLGKGLEWNKNYWLQVRGCCEVVRGRESLVI